MSKTIKDFFAVASGEFLSDSLPEGWEVWEDDDLNAWLEQNAWESYESWSGAELEEQIASVAHLLMRVHNAANGEQQ